MLRLGGISKEPYWIDLSFGWRVKVRPLWGPIYWAAQARTQTYLGAFRETIAAAIAAGGDPAVFPDFTRRETREGWSQHFFTQAMAEEGIISWEENGALPACGPPTPDLIAQLMEYPVQAQDFFEGYIAPYTELVKEGNALPAGSNGNGAAGKPTADGAPTPDSPAAPAAEGSTETSAPT